MIDVMGAEQSSFVEGEPLPSLYKGLDTTTSSSLPASPSRSSHSDSSHQSLQQSGRSLSLSVERTRLSSADTGHIQPQFSSQTQTPGSTIYRSSSVADAHGRGIVVVCPGPLQRSMKSMSYDSFGHGKKSTDSRLSTRKLEHIPSFSPFLSGTRPSVESTTRSGAKVIYPKLAQLDSSKLVDLVRVYQAHVREATETACKSQQRVLGLQNKIDYELKRLSEELKLRSDGTRSNLANSSKTCDPTKRDLMLAGQKQIDEFVLQSTQISGLLDQTAETVKQLQAQLELLNQCLPPDKRLSQLSVPMCKSPEC